MLITTTPKRQRLLRKAEDPGNHIHVTRATSDENPYFSTVRLAELKANYAGTRLYKQEIEGVFNDDVAGALFTLDLITAARIDRAEVPDLARVVVAIDPSQTSGEGSDESGIVVAGDDGCGHAYVLADCSLRGSPEQVMRHAVDAFRAYSADTVVFEDQSGGDWLTTALRHVDPNVPYKKIHAMRGKFLRAQPVAMLMEQGRIHHAGTAEVDQARNTILKTVRIRMDLLGLAAPKKSMSLQASVELDSENETLQARLAEAYSEALAEKERELAGLRAHLAQAQNSGPSALTVLAARSEVPAD